MCHTDVTNPAQSLVKSVCYPQELSFNSKQTDWGQKHEKEARELYLKTQKYCHNDLMVADSGLVINCTCCGRGVLAIKCPYSHCYESEVKLKFSNVLYTTYLLLHMYTDFAHGYYYCTFINFVFQGYNNAHKQQNTSFVKSQIHEIHH